MNEQALTTPPRADAGAERAVIFTAVVLVGVVLVAVDPRGSGRAGA